MVKKKWYCDSCTQEFNGGESDCLIEFFINKHTKDPEFQGQTQFFDTIERINVCCYCAIKAMKTLGMTKTVETLIRNTE